MSRIIMNIGEAKQQFSRLIDQAAHGTTTIIAKAGTPIAKIVPLAASCYLGARPTCP
jgi:prevent-host-death family protein